MKRVVLFLATWVISLGALAFTPDQYATQVIQKDLPRSLRWFSKIVESQQMGQVEVYDLYQSALPETQVNQQLGISVKGSVERMILLLDGARYYEQIQLAPFEYQNQKELVLHILQVTKDGMDRFQYGEDPQVLLEEWRSLGVFDIVKLTTDLIEVFTETQRLLSTPVIVAPIEQGVAAQEPLLTDEVKVEVDTKVDVEMVETESRTEEVVLATAPSLDSEPAPVPTPTPNPDSFENQRFSSYIQNAETGKVADECQSAIIWKTDQAPSCQSDDTLECDRSYARQCKKLQ